MIRTSLSLSAITGKAVSITNIRAGRPNPGLAMQHLSAAQSVRKICRGTLEGAELGSMGLRFQPGRIVGGDYDIDIGTAGSATLVAQSLIPILLHAQKPSLIRIRGGTHVMKSPGYDYFEQVFLPAVRRFGVQADARLIRPGFYPKGGGLMEVEVRPGSLHGCSSWDRDEHVQTLIRICSLDKSIAIREKKVFVQRGLGHVWIREDESASPGNSITSWKGSRGAFSLGQKGKRAELVAQDALDALDKEGEDVDSHLADQILIYAALAEGATSYRTSIASGHLSTNRDVIKRFLEREISMEGARVEIR